VAGEKQENAEKTMTPDPISSRLGSTKGRMSAKRVLAPSPLSPSPCQRKVNEMSKNQPKKSQAVRPLDEREQRRKNRERDERTADEVQNLIRKFPAPSFFTGLADDLVAIKQARLLLKQNRPG
jgi:hypothetical protein